MSRAPTVVLLSHTVVLVGHNLQLWCAPVIGSSLRRKPMPRQIITTENAPGSPYFSQGVKAGLFVFVSGWSASTPRRGAWLATRSRSKLARR